MTPHGAPYTALLARRRIARAKELLTEGGHTTADIAEAVGYHSLSHFCTTLWTARGRFLWFAFLSRLLR